MWQYVDHVLQMCYRLNGVFSRQSLIVSMYKLTIRYFSEKHFFLEIVAFQGVILFLYNVAFV